MKSRREASAPTRELRSELQAVLSRRFGAACRIVALHRRRSEYSSSYTIENLAVSLDDGRRLRLVFKDLSSAAMLEKSRRVRPEFLYNPDREIETYRRLLDEVELGTPRFYGAVQQPERDRYWLFLERVRGPLLWQIGEFEHWENSARWLAGFHNRFQRQGREGHLPAPWLHYEADHCMRWLERAELFVSRRSQLGDQQQRRRFRHLTDHYQKVVNRILAIPRTLVHGEFYPSNIILRTERTRKRICPIDWEVAGLGPGLIDLAALVSGSWTEPEKKRLMLAYWGALEPRREWSPRIQEIAEWVDYCQLHLSIQWLGWALQWSPPKNHQQNWLSEALRLARRLGI